MFFRRNDNADEARKKQLLELYWNRADVKRELGRLKKERFELLEKLEDQEQAIVRAREQLSGLERLLVNPAAAANAMVYFQLRHLWRVAAQRIEQFGSELQRQREERERRQLQDAATAKRKRRLDAIHSNVDSFREKHATLEEEVKRLQKLGESMGWLSRLIRGRRVRAAIEKFENRRRSLGEKIEELEELAERIQGEPLPEPEGLSVESRRMINTALIALAQHLVLHFADNDLAALAKKATERTVGDMKFGDRRECDRMVENIRVKVFDLKREERLGERVRERASMLAREIQYANGADAVPSSHCTATISPVILRDSKGRRSTDAPVQINVLADDYWDLGTFFR